MPLYNPAGVSDPLTLAQGLSLSDTSGASTKGVTLGSDVNLYRSAADVLKTDDEFRCGSGQNILGLFSIVARSGGASETVIGAAGPSSEAGIKMGGDANIYRSAADTLSTDDAFKLAGASSFLTFGNASLAQTTVGAAGGASALPITPTKFFKVKDSAGTTLVIPAYAAS